MAAVSKSVSDKISFIAFIVPFFAATYKMNMQEAYFYLKKYGGWKFLVNNWWALHTDSAEYATHDLYEYCYNNGGLR